MRENCLVDNYNLLIKLLKETSAVSISVHEEVRRSGSKVIFETGHIMSNMSLWLYFTLTSDHKEDTNAFKS